MKRAVYILSILLLVSCQSIEQLSIDYLLPADVSFPNSLRRIGIVNNCPDKPSNQQHGLSGHLFGNGKLAAEALAEAIANENYFDEVIICDSALQANNAYKQATMLNNAEIQELTALMDVDFLIAVEEINIETKQEITNMPDWGGCYAIVQSVVLPKFTIYLPNRQKPLVSLQPRDSIFWDRIAQTEKAVIELLPSDSLIISEASSSAGEMPLKHILPYWKTSNRYYFTKGNAAMRDAAIYIKENNWPEAVNQWKQVYDSKKKGKKRMQAAYNLALGYEMMDDLQKAYEFATEAQQIAYELEHIKEIEKQQALTAESALYYLECTRLVNELKVRKDGMMLLKAQMQRFETDF